MISLGSATLLILIQSGTHNYVMFICCHVSKSSFVFSSFFAIKKMYIQLASKKLTGQFSKAKAVVVTEFAPF